MKAINNLDELRQILAKKPVSGLGCVIALKVDGEYIVLDGPSGSIHDDPVHADCIVSTTLANISDVLAGNLDPTAAYMMGKIEIDGDLLT